MGIARNSPCTPAKCSAVTRAVYDRKKRIGSNKLRRRNSERMMCTNRFK